MSTQFERYVEQMTRHLEGFRRQDGVLRLHVEPEIFSAKLEFVEYTTSMESYVPTDDVMRLLLRRKEIVDVQMEWNGADVLFYRVHREYAYRDLIPRTLRQRAQQSRPFGVLQPRILENECVATLICQSRLALKAETLEVTDRYHVDSKLAHGIALGTFCAHYLIATYDEPMPLAFQQLATHSDIGHA